MLTQRFCDACGADLEQALQARHADHETWMAQAVAAAKEYNFDQSRALLRRVAEVQDYRFAEASRNAKQALQKIDTLQQQAVASVNDVLTRTKVALDAGNKSEVVRLLQSIPANMMSEEAKRLLAQVKSFTDQVAALEQELRSAIASKDWPMVGGLLDQLVDLAPEEKQYRQLAEQVSGKLMARAEGLLSKGQYAAAARELDAVPQIPQPPSYQQLRESVANIHWLSEQFSPEPFATPMLGRIAVRFAKEAPQDPTAARLVKKLAAELKQGQRPERIHVPRWRGQDDGWMGGKAGWLTLPKSMDWDQAPLIQSVPGRFHVAIGLALQGLGSSRVREHFGPKQRLLKSLSRRKSTSCWGVDIGSASLKAVLLEETEDGLAITDCFFRELDPPTCRLGAEEEGTRAIQAAIEELLESRESIDQIPVWANVAASKVVTRFVRLPPVKDKAAIALLDQEIEQKIPISSDELAIVRWMAEFDEDQVHGRPAIIAAAKSDVMDKRLEMLQQAGLEVAGLQADPIAVANFAAFEFADWWTGDEEVEDQDDPDSGTPTVAILDGGASSTNLILVSREAFWCWTIETGGEDLTTRLARSTKSTHAEAEQLKRNPASLPSPATEYRMVEERQDELRTRLQTSLGEALKQNPRFDVRQCWCVGGACLSHGWIRRLMLG